MIPRPVVCALLAAVLVSLLSVACGGDGESAAIPTTGAQVCERLNDSERFRFVSTYSFDSPKQEVIPPDLTPTEPGYAITAISDSFRLAQRYDGAFVQPDRADYVISTPGEPDQPTVRAITIGPNQWYYLNDAWQVAPQPVPFIFAPPSFCQAFVAQLNLTGASPNVENLGDTAARHIRLEDVTMGSAAQLFGPGSDMGRLLTSYDVDLWFSENDSRLIKAEANSSATYPFGRELIGNFALELGSYGDDEIVIQPPVAG